MVDSRCESRLTSAGSWVGSGSVAWWAGGGSGQWAEGSGPHCKCTNQAVAGTSDGYSASANLRDCFFFLVRTASAGDVFPITQNFRLVWFGDPRCFTAVLRISPIVVVTAFNAVRSVGRGGEEGTVLAPEQPGRTRREYNSSLTTL